jgi:N-acyl-D-aspartate/D-glutamate deacylase
MLGIGLDDEDDDLDPAAARLVLRMRRIMVGSMAVMFLGIVAVLAVVVYRSFAQRPSTAPPAAAAMPSLPAGSRVIAIASDGQRLYVTVETPDGAEAIEAFDAATLKPRGRLPLVPPRP